MCSVPTRSCSGGQGNRPRTTDSRHGYRLYRDLVNTSPKYTPAGNGRLVVADITYIYTREGFAYLSLVTDAYSRYIVGYCLSRSLDAEGPLKAMYMLLRPTVPTESVRRA